MIGKEPDKEITSNGPKLHEYLQEMNQATLVTKSDDCWRNMGSNYRNR